MLTGWKTIIASGLATLFGALAVVDWNPLIQNEGAGWTAVALGVVMAVLRAVTTTPVGAK